MPGIVSWLLFIAALLSLVAFGLLVVVALEVRDLVKQIKNDIIPLIGTAQQTAKSASAWVMLRHGMTSSSCMYGAPVTMALVPLMTMPFELRSTTWT